LQLLQLISRVLVRLKLARRESCERRTKAFSYRRRFDSIAQAHRSQNCYFTEDELSELGVHASEGNGPAASTRVSGTVDDAFRQDLTDYLPGDILVKTDRASMAHGLELRAPFLDVDFASFCIALPSRLKINRESDKLILRKAYGHAWPGSIRARGKQGFGAPVSQWLKRESVRALKQSHLSDPGRKIFEVISFEHSRRIVQQDDYQTWILLVLAMWMERHAYAVGGGHA
jgi:asparagine synthase (glutamine-hydrolysing)